MNEQMNKRLAGLSLLVTGSEASDPVHNFFEQHFGLPGNPFPPPGIADAAGESPPLRPNDFDKLLNFVQRGYATGESQFMVVKGEYGSGKTQTLRFIEYVVNTYMNKGDQAARAVYVERPRLGAQELNRTILRTLGQDTIRKYVWFAIHRFLLEEIVHPSQQLLDLKKNLTANRLQQQRPRRQASLPQIGLWVEDDPAINVPFDAVFNPEVILDYRTFLTSLESKGWSREHVRSYLVTLLLKAVSPQDSVSLAQTFVALLLAPDDAAFASWETLLGITNTRTTLPLRAPDFLQFLLRVMALNGIVYVYMLIDEFEEVSQTALLTARQRQDYIYTMREVLNSIQRGLSVVIGISPAGLDALQVDGVPFIDVSNEMISLPRVEVSDAIKLVQFYLDREREGTGHEMGDIYPLSRELIAYILNNFPRAAQRTPRNVVQFMHRLLNHAAENNVTALTPGIAEPLLAEFGAMKSGGEQSTRARRSARDATTTAG